MAPLLLWLLNLVTIALFARAILSWFPIGFDSPIRPVADLLHRVTEPIVGPVRRILPPMGGLDLSLFIVMIGIQIILRPLVVAVF